MEKISPLPLMQLTVGYWLSQAIYVSAKLKVADHLKDGPQTPAELAVKAQANEKNLYRLLRALATAGIFAERDDGQFEQTPLSDFLRTDHPMSVWGYVMMQGEDWHWQSWGKLSESVKTGQPAFEIRYGQQLFDYLYANPSAAAIFDQAMTNTSRNFAPLLDAYDFSGCAKVVDVGGGHGYLLESVVTRYPKLKGVVFDMPTVIEAAKRRVAGLPVADRIECRAGSFFESVPEGADAYLLKYIIHDWDDARATLILKACRQAMRPGAKLILVEHVIPEGNVPHRGKLTDLEMMVLTPGGYERTEAEFASLFASAGFRLERVVSTEIPLSLVIASPN